MLKIVPNTLWGRLRLIVLLILLIGPLLWFYNHFVYMPGRSYEGPLPPVGPELRELQSRLETHVNKLAVDIGPRNLAHPGTLEATLKYLGRVFGEIGYATSAQRFPVASATVENLVVEKPGRSRPNEILVLGAHYDTHVNSPGADDNASGIAGLVEIARSHKDRDFDRTVRYVAFVNEEPPYFHTSVMGSWVYAKECRKRNENIVGMIALEMIGFYSEETGSQQYPKPFNLIYPKRGNFAGFVSNASSAALVRECIGAFRDGAKFPSEGAIVPDRIPDVGFSDHWSFWQEGYPGIMVTDTAYFRNPHYHTPEDTPEKLDFEKMARVVMGIAEVVAELAGVEER